MSWRQMGLERWQHAIMIRIVRDEPSRWNDHVIRELICHFLLHIPTIERRHAVDFHDYFHGALNRLRAMAMDDLVKLDPTYIQVTTKGRLLIRNLCMAFDRYRADNVLAFSRTV